MRSKIFTLVFLLGLISNISNAQQDVSGWYWLNGQPTGNTLNWVKIINTSTIYAVGNFGTFMKSTDGGNTWSVNSQVGAPDNSSTGGGATRNLNTGWFFDANTGIVGGQSLTSTAGMVSKTIDGGNTWTYYNYNDTGGTVTGIYFINSNTGYITGNGKARFFKTTDAGLTWEDQSFSPLLPSTSSNAVFALDTANIFIASATSNRIYYHKPGGDSAWKVWTLPGSTFTPTDIYFKDANTGYVSGNGNYFAYTTDGGTSWTQSNPPSTVGQRKIKYTAGTLYLAGAYTEIYKSTNDGATWTVINFIDGSNIYQPTPFIINGIDVNGSDMAVVGNAGTVNTSNNGGTTWSNKNYSVNNGGSTNFSSMLVESNVTMDNIASGKIWLGANGGGSVLYSSNGGSNWIAQPTSHTRSVFGIQFLDANTGFICGGFPNNPFGVGEISKTTDGGNSWNLLMLPDIMNTSQINSVSFIDANTGYAAAFRSIFEPGLVYKTTDGGALWIPQSFDSPPGGSIVNVHMLNADSGFALANSLYTTTNGGTNWVKTTNAYVLATSWSNMFIYNKDVIYLNGNGTAGVKKVIRSVDGGLTWTDLTSNLLSTVTMFRTRWLNLKHGIVSGTNGYMAKTTNGGLSWTASHPGGSTTVGVGFPNKNAWYAVSDRNSNYEVWRKYETLTSISLNVTMGIEGFWGGKPMVTDTVKVQLRSSTSPYGLVEEASEVVNINGYATYEYYSATAGSYYVVLRHRNSLETWSAAPVAVTAGGNHNYDFTTSASQTFGNNTTLKSGRYCDYSGDVDQDGSIDVTDITTIYNDASIFSTGYIVTDVNGDSFADVTDLLITYNNSVNFVGVIRP